MMWLAFFCALSTNGFSQDLGTPLSARFHSHNDYEQARPLTDALEAKAYSVEADVWYAADAVRVSHDGRIFKGTLEDLYLKPLQERVNQAGSVYGDGVQVYLWLDLKESSLLLTLALKNLLPRYSMLSNGAFSPVHVILTGNERAKKNLVAALPWISRDSLKLSSADESADSSWDWYTVDFADVVPGETHGPFEAKNFPRLVSAVQTAHEKGRRIRLWDLPNSPGIWQELLDLGVDLISVDDLWEMEAFSRAHGILPATRAPETARH